MNDRERFHRYVRFQAVDRPPRWEWCFRPDTTALWYAQGLARHIPEALGWVEYWGLDRGAPFIADSRLTRLGINIAPLPDMAAEAVGETEQYILQKNTWGAVGKALKTGIHSIPQFVSFGVRSREDWLAYRQRLNPHDPARYPADWEERKAQWRVRDYPLLLATHGWYGVLREMMGMEGLSVAFYDQPALIEEICEFWGDFIMQLFERALAEVGADYVLFWEDLAYKAGPLLSPRQFRRFFLPHYQRVIAHLRRRGVETFMVDSDGNIDAITPLWLEAGINMLGPYEVAAGMDVVTVGRTYKDLALVGGIDKREIAHGRKAIEAEVLRRVPPLLERGGYFPTLDHSTIPELALDDYRYYREFLQKVCEG
jgi:hypothetical protein